MWGGALSVEQGTLGVVAGDWQLHEKARRWYSSLESGSETRWPPGLTTLMIGAGSEAQLPLGVRRGSGRPNQHEPSTLDRV